MNSITQYLQAHGWDWLPSVLAIPFTALVYFAVKGFFRWGKRIAHIHRLDYTKRVSRFAFSVLGAGLFLRLAPLEGSWNRWGTRLILSAELYQVGIWAEFIFTRLLQRFLANKESTDKKPSAAADVPLGSLFPTVIRIGVWSFVVLLIFDNLGIQVTSLITGLGIGGIAVALAAQNVLGDFFASLSIALDQPFKIGEFIQFGGFMGTVRTIGVKTSRLESLSGEEIVISNAELLKQTLRNYTRMKQRRVVGTFGLAYDTPAEQVARVPDLIRAAVDAHPEVRLERAHFSGFGESSLSFEYVYWVKSDDYNLYMDLQQQICLQIMRGLAQEKLNFYHAYKAIRFEADSRGFSSHRPDGARELNPSTPQPSR